MAERYIVTARAGHPCCYSASVEDTTRPQIIGDVQWKDQHGLVFATVCECFDTNDAALIAAALNDLNARSVIVHAPPNGDADG